jgi:phage-related protein
MGYKVLYDNQLLFDPYTNDRITDTKLSSKLNAASYFDFTIAPTHSLYSKLAERAGEVRIYFNNLILFKGEITKMEEDFEGNYSVSCTGVLDYLTATRVRPYSTVEGEQPLKAPSSYDGYFQWLIDQHNSNCLDSRKHFSVGVNQGNMLDKNNYIYRASEQRPTTASEIEDKILNSDGGYLFVRYEDDLNILDLYADVHDVNTQIIDYGVNMLDFTKTTTAESQYTAVVATGYTPNPPEGQPDAKMKPITLEGCTDGGTPYSSTIVKMGDRVYDVEAVARYGYNEYYVSNTDITTYDGLLYYACKTLNTLLSPALTISVKAVDLALIMGDKYKHLQLGQAVRIRSKPRKVDEYLMVNSIDLDLMNPENTTFDLGASYDTLTGQQSAYLKSLNASINTSLDTVSALGDNVKNSAKLAQEAKDTANSATEAANNASSKADQATETANNASSKADTANSNATKANATANSANKTANAANDTANKANAKADTANKTANAASSKADTANDTANKADTKADQAITSAGVANNTANSASSKADDAVKKAEQTQENIKVVQKSVDAANEAASNAQTSADAASTAASAAQATADTAKANASKAQTAADAAQSSANAANSAASKAQKSADAANSAIANTNKEVGTINSTITQIKKDAADTRDELSGQIETVKNTMTTDYAKKTELSETEGTLRSEIETSAAGIKSEVSQNYTTKTELSNTNEKVSKAQNTADKAAAAAASNASDLTAAIKTIGKTTDDLQSQIDGSIQTWFEDGEPTNLNYPAIDWTTDTIKKNHLGDLYYDNTTGYGYRWQVDQNGSYSWKHIVDTDVTKALQDAAKAQGTANSKRRIFVTTPVPPYDVADLWVQGTTGDIMRCQTAKTEGQTYAAADWIKASKYTDDTAVTKLAETVSVTYATKTTVNQLSDRIEQTVESVETVSASASAAQAAADKANSAAKAAQSTADTAKANAATAQTSADTAKSAAAAAQKAADNAKSAADTAQSAADTANADLATAKKNLEAVQNQADATDEQVAAAKAAVVKAQGAADKANAAAATAKSAADTAQSTANTAKANAATAQTKANEAASAASTAQSTADTAKANAATAQADVNALKSRVTKAETSIKQNSDAIALRATKTEVTNAANTALSESKKYTDAQLKITSDSITSTVSKTYATKTQLEQTSSTASTALSTANTAKTNAATAQTAADSANAAASNAQTTADTASSAASKAQQTANNVTKDLADNYTTTVDMNSKIEQTANSIKSEVSKTYQPKGDYATNSSVQSAIEQSASSITSTVSKTYATKTSVDTLQNIADNAIESWYLVGVPSGTNKPASDWTTNTLKKQHVGDMYYDKDTGYSYRWLQDGTEYKWIQIKDNDITTANAVANAAKSTAESAASTANTANKTASAASTKATNAATDAATAKSDASTAKTTANTAKSTADAASKTANTAKSTADNAAAAATTAQDTADTAKANAATAQADVNALKSRVTKAETSIKQNSDAIALRATKTEVTNAANTALSESKKYTDAQLKITSDSITSTVSKTYATKAELDTTNENVTNAQGTAATASSNASNALSKANTALSTSNTAKSTATTASNNANTALSTANTANKTATTASNTASTALSTANTAKSTADTANKTANTVKDDLANLSIGGRNYLPYCLMTPNELKSVSFNSSNGIYTVTNTKNYNGGMLLFKSRDLPIGTYSVSAGKNIIAFVVNKHFNYTWTRNDYYSKLFESGNGYVAYSTNMTFVATEPFQVGFVVQNSITEAEVGPIKLEKGSKPTDWSPAPEDYSTTTEMQSSINQTAESIKSMVAATYVNNETLSSYATKTQLEQTSESLTTRIQTTETTVAGMSTTVKNVDDYMTFARENNQPTLTIGSSSSSFRTKLTNTGEKFMQGDQTIMELDGITSTVKASRVQMGHYQWRDTGTSMQLIYIP